MSKPNTQEINVGLNGAVYFKPIVIKQFDKNTRRIEITLLEGSDIYEIPVNSTVKFQATKQDGKIIFDDCNVEDGIIVYNATEKLSTSAGTVKCEIGIYEPDPNGDISKDGLLQSATFDILVEKSAMDRNAVVSSDEFNTLTIMINTITGLVEKAENTIKEINIALSKANNATTNAIIATDAANLASINNTKMTDDAIANMSTLVNSAISEANIITQSNIDAINQTNQTITENESTRISLENIRKSNETIRELQEQTRQTNSFTSISNADAATTRANLAAKAAEDVLSGIIEMPDIGIPGTYTKVTTDVKGRVTSGINPTSITDFGIVDVYTKDETDMKMNTKAEKTEIPTTLPANGGNADTVGNKHASDFATVSHVHDKIDISLGNVDNTADADKSVKFATTSASCTGNSVTATKLATARTINGVIFDGTANVTVVDSTKMPLTGGTYTGKAYAYTDTDYTTLQLRNISASTSAVTSLANGAIHLVYEA